MAQTISHSSPADLAHKQLQVEKLGVVAGFLAGLPLAVGFVSDALAAVHTPEALIAFGGVVTVALTTALGLRIGKAVADRIKA
ncbi:MAG: hypothetical protein ACM3VZ_10090 [Acidobacteriota bacterium]